MLTLLRNEEIQITYDDPKRLFIAKYTTPEDLTRERFLELFEYYYEAVKNYKPEYILIDGRNALYAIPLDLQEKVNEKIGPLYNKIGIKKMAILMSSAFIAQLSFEQVAEETNSEGLQISYFENDEQAYQWFRGEKLKDGLRSIS